RVLLRGRFTGAGTQETSRSEEQLGCALQTLRRRQQSACIARRIEGRRDSRRRLSADDGRAVFVAPGPRGRRRGRERRGGCQADWTAATATRDQAYARRTGGASAQSGADPQKQRSKLPVACAGRRLNAELP